MFSLHKPSLNQPKGNTWRFLFDWDWWSHVCFVSFHACEPRQGHVWLRLSQTNQTNKKSTGERKNPKFVPTIKFSCGRRNFSGQKLIIAAWVTCFHWNYDRVCNQMWTVSWRVIAAAQSDADGSGHSSTLPTCRTKKEASSGRLQTGTKRSKTVPGNGTHWATCKWVSPSRWHPSRLALIETDYFCLCSPQSWAPKVRRRALSVLARLRSSQELQNQPQALRALQPEGEKGSVRRLRPLRREPGSSLCLPVASHTTAQRTRATQM